jgi:hypothetical protein
MPPIDKNIGPPSFDRWVSELWNSPRDKQSVAANLSLEAQKELAKIAAKLREIFENMPVKYGAMRNLI